MKRARAAGLATLLALGTFGQAGAGATAAAPAPSQEFCTVFADYYTAQFLLALVSGFAQIGKSAGVDPQEVKATYALALSPKLLEITRDMRRSAPAVLRANLARHVRIYLRGIELLRDAGIPPKVIRAIAALDVNSDSGDFDLDKEVRVSDAKLKAAGREFARFAKPVLDWRPPRAAAAFLGRAANECGIVPDSGIDCDALVSDTEASALLGGTPTLDDQHGCVWATTGNASSDNTLEVDVYASDMAYTLFADRHDRGEYMPGVGDAAVTVTGFVSSGTTKSCGRTVVTRHGDRTVQLALCLGDQDISVEQVRSLAEQVLGRI